MSLDGKLYHMTTSYMDNTTLYRMTFGQGLRDQEVRGQEVGRSTRELVLLYLALILMVIIIVGGAVGNMLVILAVKTTKKLHTSSNAFIVNLAVCDLVLITMILPFNIYTYINDGWDLDPNLCKAVGFLGYSFAGTTLINVCLIAYNRYKLVSDPGGYTEVFRPLVIAVLLTTSWTLPMLFLLPSLLDLWGHFGYVAMLATCNLYLNHSTQSFRLLLLFVRAIVPGTLIAYCYTVILRLSRESHHRVQLGLSNMAAYDHLTRKQDLRLTRTMGVICLVFLLSYIPCLITGIIDWSYVLSKSYHMYCEITVFIASAINPLIYGLMNSQFREAYFHLLCCHAQKHHAPSRHRVLRRHSLRRRSAIITTGSHPQIDNILTVNSRIVEEKLLQTPVHISPHLSVPVSSSSSSSLTSSTSHSVHENTVSKSSSSCALLTHIYTPDLDWDQERLSENDCEEA